MKKTYLLVIVLLLSIAAYGQGRHILQFNSHSYVVGDSLLKQQVDYIEPGAKGIGIVWNFQNIKPINESYLLTYSRNTNADTATLCAREHRTRYYYHQCYDSLSLTGFENATTFIKYIQPELRIKFPLSYGDTLFRRFWGVGQYCNKIPLRVNGYSHINVDAEGDLLLPNVPALKKAIRVHTRKRYFETGKDSVEINYDTYSWYATGSRYPVFESLRSTLIIKGQKDTTFYATSFFYPPLKQSKKQVSDSVDTSNIENEINRIFTEARYMPNPVINNLDVDYKLTRNANVWFSIHNSHGIKLHSTSPKEIPEGYHSTTISMSGLMTGIYLLYVHVDDMMLKVSIIKV